MNKFKFKTKSKTSKIITGVVTIFLLVIILFAAFEIYVPINPFSHETVTYIAPKGWSDNKISADLQKLGLIRNSFFFQFYVIASFKHSSLQAGKYIFSPQMSIYQIASKMADGGVVKDKLIILEGWDTADIGNYLESKGVCKESEFISLTKNDYSNEFDFLKDAPKGATLEGYLFPDTYEFSDGDTCQDFIITMLKNFDKKLTPDLRAQITKQKKTIFQTVTMASLLEKEVRGLNDKKIVSGILWKRISIGMPLQLDCTVNYVTNKNDPGVSIKDTKINSPYNTYKYKGLPKGPISNPGLESIIATLNPTKTDYWFYLSDGITIFSKTMDEQNANKAKYLN